MLNFHSALASPRCSELKTASERNLRGRSASGDGHRTAGRKRWNSTTSGGPRRVEAAERKVEAACEAEILGIFEK